ncbi:MAG: zinc-binding dehydrogenase [Candidatus Eremiobacteraeota bacterium]|nr:zinc-binding dehydrogenase [Candidatus Eremiobacteraeota bacterium]
MKAVRLHEIGGPEKLRTEDIPNPVSREGETLVRVHAAALNHRDVFITRGLYPNIALPCTLGADGCGELDGRRVVIDPLIGWGNDPNVWDAGATILGVPRDGTFAQYVSVPAANVYDPPAHLDDSECAALPLGGLTAYRAVITRGKISAGETVLITGIGGGVQTFALLFAKALGARVAVTSSSDEKLERARSLGADITVNYRTTPDWHKAARKEAGAIDVAIDSAGGETFAKLTTIVRPGGRIVTYGGTTGDATIRMFPVFWNHLTILGTSMGSPHDFSAMLEFVRAEKIRPIVDRVFALDDARAAFDYLDRAEQFGKVVLAIPE